MVTRVFCIGNGESRAPVDLIRLRPHGKIYGCNGLYRDFTPDVLCAVDHAIMHEVYHSGYCDKNETWLRDWVPLPGLTFKAVVYGGIGGDDLKLAEEHLPLTKSVTQNEKGDRQNFVFHGSNLAGRVSVIKRLKEKPGQEERLQKEINHRGIFVSWINPDDKANCLRDLDTKAMRDRGWACGASSGWVALKQNPDLKELYLIGHDLKSDTHKINNMYKGTNCYGLPEASAIPSTNWITQWKTLMNEFPKVQFIKVNPKGDDGSTPVNSKIDEWHQCKNLKYMNFDKLNENFNCK